jgi:hypothetical protein
MNDFMTSRLRQLHIEMKVLKDKKTSGAKLTQSEQAELDQLTTERDSLLTDTFFHTY